MNRDRTSRFTRASQLAHSRRAFLAPAFLLTIGAGAQVPASQPAQPPIEQTAPQGSPSQTPPTPQQIPSPSPALPPDLPLPALSPAPTQRTVPGGPVVDQTPTANTRGADVPPLTAPVPTPNVPAPQLDRLLNSRVQPVREGATGLAPNFLRFLGPYRRPTVSPLYEGNADRLKSLIRDGKLYITLQDAIALALENNLDVEAERYNIVLGHLDEVRAAGGGSTRGIDYSVTLPPAGVGGPGSPLLNASTVNSNPVTPTVTDLTSLNSTTQMQQSLSQISTGFTYSAGPSVPLYDPQLIGELSYLRRSDTQTLTGGVTGTGTTTTTTTAAPLDFTALNLAYLQGFSTGAQLEATVNNDSQVIYAGNQQLDPFHAPSASVTLTQPLLRGRGRDVSLRYLRIARLDTKASRLVFEQQILESIYGVSRLYFDLVSLGENVLVKQEALRAATKQREDDEEQVKLGTLAPIEYTRAQALESSSRFDLAQSQGLYRQQEVILRHELLRVANPAFEVPFTEIVPTDRIVVPSQPEALDVPELVKQGLARRPDLAQAVIQAEAGKINVQGSRSAALPQLNLYANVETRGASEQAYDTLGTTGTGVLTAPPANLALGGLRVSTIYQGGVQLTLPLRNRVAASDAARDTVQLRQIQARTEKLSAQVREEIEVAVVALQTADAAYRAAVQSLGFQQQLLDAERDRLSVGQSTDLAVLQNEAYVAQARSTEIAARSDYQKARIELDRSLGDLLEKNNIELDDAIQGKLP